MWTIAVLGISHTLFGIALLFRKREKDRSDLFLIIWLIILMCPFLNEFISYFASMNIMVLRFNNQAFTLLHGPFLFLYLREISKQKSFSIFHYLPHIIPFLFFYIVLVLKPIPMKPGGGGESLGGGFILFKYFGVINLIIFLLYGIASLIFLIKHSQMIKDTFAFRNGEISLMWLILLPGIFLVFVSVNVFIENSSVRAIIAPDKLQLLLFLFFTLYIIFFGLRQKSIYRKEDESTQEKKQKNIDPTKDLELMDKIKNIMIRDKIFRDPILSVYDLAEAMEISRHRVSGLLNENLSMNFFQFVNQYRLEDVAQRLKNDKENRYNILELAFESGFNSKSSFNSLFKKQYGLTPSQYKKSLISNKNEK